MTKAQFDALKSRVQEIKQKSTDMDTMVNAISKLPYGQLKKVLTDEVLEVLAKYGYAE